MENVIGVITQVFLVLLTGGDKNTERMHAEANWKIARDYTPSRLRARWVLRGGGAFETAHKMFSPIVKQCFMRTNDITTPTTHRFVRGKL